MNRSCHTLIIPDLRLFLSLIFPSFSGELCRARVTFKGNKATHGSLFHSTHTFLYSLQFPFPSWPPSLFLHFDSRSQLTLFKPRFTHPTTDYPPSQRDFVFTWLQRVSEVFSLHHAFTPRYNFMIPTLSIRNCTSSTHAQHKDTNR